MTYSNGEKDDFDTVLCAIGREADTKALGLHDLDVEMNPRNGKLICRNEQTSVPNIYAVGDVIENVPELTPSAILAGKLLARRLFGGQSEAMDYGMIATTVFTPLEFGTIGLSEEAAREKYGSDRVECYVSVFDPLEWTIVEKDESQELHCFAKIVVLEKADLTTEVIGLHIVSPHAGEIIQGYAVAVKKGISYEDLLNTVGIHPTIAEEFTTMTIKKSSGTSAKKASC